METKVSTKGQVVIPSRIRHKLGLRAGDPLDATVECGKIVLTPRKKRPKRVRIVTDPVTGLPVLDLGPDAPGITSEQVAGILAEYP